MATRFWVGGTGTWDGSSTTHWAATTGGSSGASVPGSADTVTFDGSSGGGTVTVNTNPNCISLTMGAFTGTIDFSVNNNSPTFQTISTTGSGARTLKMGSGTWTLSGTGTVWNGATTTSFTLTPGSSTVNISDTSQNAKTIATSGLTLGAISLTGAGSGSRFRFSCSGGTIGTLTVTAPCTMEFQQSATVTITNAFNWAGSSSNQINIRSQTQGTPATISVASGSPTMSWAGVCEITFSGGATFTATNSFDLGQNSGITITAPSSSGGGISRARAFAGFY